MILLITGGHGFKVLEKVEMLEIKQGPFLGDKDKIRLKTLKKFIPVNEPLVTNSDVLSVSKVLKSGWISSEGPNVKLFEKNFAKYIGHKNAVSVSSGTAALEVAIKALNLKKGDEVIAPNFTIISSTLAVIKEGLKIKFIDCNLYDWNMNLDKTIKSIKKKLK